MDIKRDVNFVRRLFGTHAEIFSIISTFDALFEDPLVHRKKETCLMSMVVTEMCQEKSCDPKTDGKENPRACWREKDHKNVRMNFASEANPGEK